MSEEAIAALQASGPQLTTLRSVQIVKTGIEYPLASGPATFTPEDLADAVRAQDDPTIPSPRIWLGHYDDERIHGDRKTTRTPSGEPAVGKVTNMQLVNSGHDIIGDLVGIPSWLAHIMSTAYPSRSIEGRFGWETPQNKKYKLVISELALLGVVWPGVNTLDDIASLFTAEGPAGLEVINATEDEPVTTIAASERTVAGQVTVEDLRRQFYDSLSAETPFWWIRSIYLDPNELIVDDDDGGLMRVGFSVSGEEVSFDDPKEVKIKYVNASHGGIEAEPINKERAHVAVFASRAEARPEGADPAAPNQGIEVRLDSIQVNLTERNA